MTFFSRVVKTGLTSFSGNDRTRAWIFVRFREVDVFGKSLKRVVCFSFIFVFIVPTKQVRYCVKHLGDIEEGNIQQLQFQLMLLNDDLEQPDGIGCPIARLECHLADVPGKRELKLLCQNTLKASDGNIQHGGNAWLATGYLVPWQSLLSHHCEDQWVGHRLNRAASSSWKTAFTSDSVHLTEPGGPSWCLVTGSPTGRGQLAQKHGC